MRFLVRRRISPAYYDANSQRHRTITSHRVKRCYVCTFEFPEADMIIEDGLERCPLCADTYTAEYLKNEQKDVADVKRASADRLQNPTQFSTRALTESRPAAVTSITDANGNDVDQATPLSMSRGGAAVTLLLNGQYFTSSVTFTYPTGVTDNSAPVITSTLITLSLVASIGMTAGAYSITLNDGVSSVGHSYLNILSVR